MSFLHALLIVAGGTAPVAAPADVTITIPSAADVGGLEILVSEIAADIKGDDPTLVEQVKATSLGYAPAPGYSRVLRADLVEASLRAALPGVDIELQGAPRCRVTPMIVKVTGVQIQAEAAAAMRKALAGIDADAKPEGKVADVLLPGGVVEPRMTVDYQPKSVTPGIATLQVHIWLGDRIYRTISTSFRVSIWKRQAVLRRAINVGESLHAGLFEVKRVPVEQARGLQALRLDELAGAIALRPMTVGSTVVERDVHREVVARKGDLVTVRIAKGAVRVTDVGVIQLDARMGERVRVQLRSTGRELIGVVRGPQLLEVVIQ